MIIFVGGLPGDGRNYLASRLARRLQLHPYSKLVSFRYSLPPHVRWMPYSDTFSQRMVQKTSMDFPLLLKMHPRTIITHEIHTARARELLFESGRRFGDVIIVWIETADEHARELLHLQTLDDMQIKRRLLLRSEMQKQLQPITEPHIVFKNTGAPEESAARFCDVVLNEIHVLESATAE